LLAFDISVKFSTNENSIQSIKHSVEFIESKYCLTIKTMVPEILLNIENGDDIIFMMNIMSRYNETMNLHINENRNLILS